jgi:hypothetical protein
MSDAADHLRSLRAEIVGPLTPERFAAWREGSNARANFIANKIFGSIAWSKELGEPDTATMAAGFVIDHLEWYVEIDSTGAVDVTHRGWRPSDVPTAWDAPDDANHHRVVFLCDLQPLGNLVRVTLAPQHLWHATSPRLGPLQVVPVEHVVPPASPGPVLVDFEVSTVPEFNEHRLGS